MILRLLIVLSLFVTGCSAALADATNAVNASQVALKAQHDGLEEVQRAAETAVVEATAATGGTEAEARARLAVMRPPFTHAWDAYEKARIAWLAAHAAVSAANAADAAHKTPDVPHVLALIAASATAWGALLDAVEHIPTKPPTSPVAAPPAPAAPVAAPKPIALAWSHQ